MVFKYKIDGWNNFCRVFEIPESYSNDFCFDGGCATNFQMIDWFLPVPLPQPAVTKEIWKKEIGEIEIIEKTLEELRDILEPFILRKLYIKPNRKYLVICSFDACFIFNKKV